MTPTPVLRPAMLMALACLVTAALSSPALAARIPEPEMTIYGRIVRNWKGYEFPVTRGVLAWTFRTSLGKEHRFETRILAAETRGLNYTLRVPLQWLGYDLSVAQGAAGLTSGGTRVVSSTVTLDNMPLRVLPLIATADESLMLRRGDSRRIFLELSDTPSDSDDDGLPDDWEDSQGFDKWNPSDGPAGLKRVFPMASTAGNHTLARTFSEWRATLFPEYSGSTESFSALDSDGDGIPNLLEYAFALDPKTPDVLRAQAMPTSVLMLNRMGVQFRPRRNALDLDWHVDTSENLMMWREASDALEWRPADESGNVTVLERTRAESSQFFRVRVSLK